MKKRFQGIVSQDYDLLVRTVSHHQEMQSVIAKAVAEHTFARTSVSVLEIGVGTGLTTRELLQDSRLSITAIDSEPIMLEQSRKNLDEYITSGRVRLVERDCLEYLSTCTPKSFDAVVTANTLHNFENSYRTNVLSEIRRCLRDEGLFVNGDKYALQDPAKFIESMEWQIGKYKEVFLAAKREDLLAAWTRHEEYDARPDIIMKEEDAERVMNAVGFTNVRFIWRKKMSAVLVAVA